MRRPGWILLAALWLHQLAIAFLSPLSAEDWTVAIDGPRSATVGALYHALIVDSRIAHLLFTPLVAASMPLALAAHVRGRRLRLDDRDDAVLLLLLSSLLWLTTPHIGLAYSFRAVVAVQILGVAATSWYVLAFRAAAVHATSLPGAAQVALALGGVIAGSTTRPLATVALAVCAVIAARAPSPRRRPLLVGLAGLAIGAALAWQHDLAVPFRQFLDRGFDGNLRYLNTHLRVPSWVTAGVLALWLGHTAWSRHRGRSSAPLDARELDLVIIAAVIALAIEVIALVTTDLAMAQLVAPGAASAMALAIPLAHLARGRRIGVALVVAALLVALASVTTSLRVLVPAHATFRERIDALAAAAPGTIAKVPPYRKHESNPWFFGEDFRISSLRDRVATRIFGLRGIELDPALHGQQPVPPLALRLEHDGGDPDPLPGFYSADLATAREQLADALPRAHPREARLIADGLVVPDHPHTPVLAAWSDGDRLRWWRVAELGLDREGKERLGPTAIGVVSMWSFDLATGQAERLVRGDDGAFRLHPGRRMTAGIVACTLDRCGLGAVIPLY